MRICTFTRSLPAIIKGGMENHALVLATGLARKGHEVTIVTTRHPRGLEYEEVEGVKIHYLKNTKSGRYSRSWWKESTKKFKELHKENPFDIIHSQSAGAYYLLKKGLNRRYKIPVVITLHGISHDLIKTSIRTDIQWKQPLRSLKGLVRMSYYLYHYIFMDLSYIPRADAIIAISERERLTMTRALPLRCPVFKVYNGIDASFFAPRGGSIRELYGIKSEDVVLLTLCRLTKDKGVQYVIRALPPLLRKYSNLILMVVGGGDFENHLRGLVKKLSLDDYVIFTSIVASNDIPSVYNSCDIFVNPTVKSGGLDLTIFEAMACEKPVIVSKIGSFPEVISDHKDGILVPPGNVDALTRSLDNVLSKPVWMRMLGRNAREKVLREFTLESMCERTIKVYEYAIGKRQAGLVTESLV